MKKFFSISLSLILSTFTFAQDKEALKRQITEQMKNGFKTVDVSSIPDKYSFSWKYTMQITTEKNKNFQTDYFLQPNATYYGASVNSNKKKSEMFMIMDSKRKIMISTFGDGEKKNAMASSMPDYSNMNNSNTKKLTYKSIPGKSILGYQCKGMQASNEDMTIVFYYTNQAKVSFSQIFQSGRGSQMPDIFKDYFKPNENPLSLEIIYTDLKKNQTTTMKCIALEPNSFSFNKADYKFM